jgi:alpha-galactosidase
MDRGAGLTRRQVLGAAIAAPLVRAWSPLSPAAETQPASAQKPFDLNVIQGAPGFVVPADGSDVSAVELTRLWTGSTCRSRVTNRAVAAIRIREIVLFDIDVRLGVAALLYAESFQMLSQTGGMLGTPVDIGSYTDAKHYRIPAPEGAYTFFGAMTIQGRCDGGVCDVVGLGFASTRKFAGLFRWRPPSALQVVVDAEGLTLGPGETWELEDFIVASAYSREQALTTIGKALAANHPRLPWPKPPTGWCSWYCFGANVTAQNILDNLDAIAKKIPGLTYVQIDDGYQPAMGDWLESGPAFGGDVRKVLDAIRARGFQPAIWVAPFVAEEQSQVFQQHRDWFVKDADGSPLRSDKVTFGGWRHAPWYVLDGTHPDVQAHFEHIFSTMRREWGVTYFKLDANFWGAIHGGRFHDPQATRIEAYRRGMQAVIRGAGDGFLLGCNHPIWPSAGLIHGSRSSNDIKRTWDRIKTTAEQNMLRNWQNGLLWWNDPDAVCLAGDLPEHEFVYHATAIFATGGMVLSGDDLSRISASRLAMLKKLLPPTGVAAVLHEDSSARITLADREMVCLFNAGEQPRHWSLRFDGRPLVLDMWTGESLGRRRELKVTLAPHSARLLECSRG